MMIAEHPVDKALPALPGNEMAVSLFLKKKIPYLTIPDMIQASMEHHKKVDAPDVDQILAAEAETYDFIHSKWNI